MPSDTANLGATRVYLTGDRTKAASYIPQARKRLIMEEMYTMGPRLDMARRIIRLASDVTMQVLSLGGVNTVVINAVTVPDVVVTSETSSLWGPWDAGTPIPSAPRATYGFFGVSFNTTGIPEAAIWVDEDGKWWLGSTFKEGDSGVGDLAWVEIPDEDLSQPAVNLVGVHSSFDTVSPVDVFEIRPPVDTDTKPNLILHGFDGPTDATSAWTYSQGSGLDEWTDGDSPGPNITGWTMNQNPISGVVDSDGNIYGVVTVFQEDATGAPTTEYHVEVVKNGTVTVLENDTDAKFWEQAHILVTSDDRLIAFYYDAALAATSYKYSTNQGVSWSARQTLSKAPITDDSLLNNKCIMGVGKIPFFSNRNFTDKKLRVIHGTDETDLTAWSDIIFPFGDKTTTGFTAVKPAGSADGSKVVFLSQGEMSAVDGGGNWIALYTVNRSDPADVSISKVEEFQLVGNPDFEDPAGATVATFARQVDDGTVYVGMVVNEGGGVFKLYRRKRAA